MNTKIIIILVVVILTSLSVIAVKKHIDNSVVDKYGMVKTPEDDIILCRYSSGGGMDGSSESLEIRQSENGGTVITYDYTSLTSDKDISKSVEAPFTPLKEIRDICKKYRIFSWGKLKKSEEFILDAPVSSIYISTGEAEYSFSNMDEIPENAWGITTEIYNVMKSYIEGVD